MLPLLAQELSQCLVSLPGVEVEIKELGVRVHVRRADPSAVAVVVTHAEALRRTSAAEFRVWPSESTVDLFPDVEWAEGRQRALDPGAVGARRPRSASRRLPRP
jgi:trehalose-6-phosphatase